jgi:2-dehydropantoate 2-reductase
VFGAGSVGIFLGTKLYAAGYEVVLHGGRKLRSVTDPILINQETFALPPRIYQLKPDHYDAIFITTKLYDTPYALKELAQYDFHPEIIAFIQNGLVSQDFYEELSQHPGFTTFSAFSGYNLADNQILVTETVLGLQTEDTLAGRKVCALLLSAKIRCHITADLAQMRAKKLIFNVAMNALSAIEKKPFGDLISESRTREIIDGMIYESWQVLKDDYELPNPLILKEGMYNLVNQVPEHYSSMYQDLISGRNTEIDFLNGFIIQLGQQKGIFTPYNRQVYCQFLAQEGRVNQHNLIAC